MMGEKRNIATSCCAHGRTFCGGTRVVSIQSYLVWMESGGVKGVGMLGLMLLGLDRLPCVSLAMLA